MKTIKRKKILVHQIRIDQMEASKRFSIRVPANVEYISGVMVTATINEVNG